jgi:hypothetical protein
MRCEHLGVAALVLLVGVVACSGDDDVGIGPPSRDNPGDNTSPGTQADSGGPADTSDAGTTPIPDGATPTPDSSPPPSDAGHEGGHNHDAGVAASCTGLLYCDDFEAYSGTVADGMTLGPWKASVSGATMTVDGVKPHAGTKSLHITTPAGLGAHGTLAQTVAAGIVPGNNMFGRAMLYYSNATGYGLPLAVHSWFFNSTGTSTALGGNVTMNIGGGGAKMQINYHPVPPATEQSVQGGTMTAGAWHCLQWQYNGSGATPADDAKVWVDGTLAVEATAAKGWKFATPWSTFLFGFTHYQTLAAGDAVDVYLDDFALNDTMVACPP